jgi:hypothetical protein
MLQTNFRVDVHKLKVVSSHFDFHLMSSDDILMCLPLCMFHILVFLAFMLIKYSSQWPSFSLASLPPGCLCYLKANYPRNDVL